VLPESPYPYRGETYSPTSQSIQPFLLLIKDADSLAARVVAKLVDFESALFSNSPIDNATLAQLMVVLLMVA
jgi:hypothetical protein